MPQPPLKAGPFRTRQRNQWRLIQKLIRHKHLSAERDKSQLLSALAKLEPLTPFNRLRAAEILTRSERPDVALRLIKRGFRRGERHPLVDYERAYALWALGRSREALKEAKEAAAKWKHSKNIMLVGYMYVALGQKERGERWMDRAIKRADEELADERLIRINPFGKLTRTRNGKGEGGKPSLLLRAVPVKTSIKSGKTRR